MDTRRAVIWGAIIGSSVGGFMPALWGGSIFSFTGMVFTALFTFGGMWLGFKLARG